MGLRAQTPEDQVLMKGKCVKMQHELSRRNRF